MPDQRPSEDQPADEHREEPGSGQGPEAQQLAIYVGWLLNGVRGGLVAGTLFVLLGLSALYVAFGESMAVVALFAGLAPAVLAVVAQAVIRVGRRSLGHPAMVALAIAAVPVLQLPDQIGAKTEGNHACWLAFDPQRPGCP